jgi:hypothetical protein
MSGFGSLSQPEEEYIITESLPDTSIETQTSDEEAILTTGVPVPSNLQTVNVASQYYVIYDENKKDIFNSWWKNTSVK